MLRQYVAYLIVGASQDLPDDMQRVKAYSPNRPADVAPLPMRESARRLSLPPATVSQVAQRLRHSGYVELKALP